MANENILSLSDVTTDYDQYKTQLTNSLALKAVWKGTLTTQSSQTLIELAATVGTHNSAQIIRYNEDQYSETAVSDDAIRAIAQMEGIRTSRKLPSQVECELMSPTDITLAPLTQGLIGGQFWFLREQLTLVANTPQIVTMYQGSIQNYALNGTGENHQFFVSDEDQFQVSDQDVQVSINSVVVEKVYGGLWFYKDEAAYQDSTTNDGRLLIQFGSNRYGVVPQRNDLVVIRYPVTLGDNTNDIALAGTVVVIDGIPDVTGTVTLNPTGGSPEQGVLAYKNLAAGYFGTYNSAVTGKQYKSLVGIYPGVQDAITQAQREINPSALEWMNVIRVSALTNSPWTQQQKTDFINYMQRITMYSGRFVWVDALPVPRDLVIRIYCYNTAILSQVESDAIEALQDLFKPKPGILMTNFYESDLDSCVKLACQGAVSYCVVDQPTSPMIVTAPESPSLHYDVLEGAGTLDTRVYSYGMSSVINGEEGAPTNWISPQVVSPAATAGINLTWTPVGGASEYRLYGRVAGSVGLIATIPATDPLVFLDNGSIIPSGNPPNQIPDVPIRYNQLRSLSVTAFFAERQQRIAAVDIKPKR